MKKKNYIAIIALILVLSVLEPCHIFAASRESYSLNLRNDFIKTTFTSGFGDTPILLRKGFDFIDTDSRMINWDLAMIGVTLSGHVYDGDGAERLLKDSLGYDDAITTTPLGSKSNVAYHPVSSMGYKHLTDEYGNEKNVFAVVIRGTSNLSHDWITDLYDGAETMFDVSRGLVAEDLEQYIQNITGKSIETLKQEDNYFFFTGHSLGGAVANALSVDGLVSSLCKDNKGHIYTYTYESPRTCVKLWWNNVEDMSNAFNFKDCDDAIINVAPYIGGTTYGKDLIFSVNNLDNRIFKMVFPHAKGGSVTEAPHPWNYSTKWFVRLFGHHDRGLCLVYILEHGIADGWWEQVYQFDDTISMWPKEAITVYDGFPAHEYTKIVPGNIQLISLNTNLDNTISVDGVNTDVITVRTDSGNDWATSVDLNVNDISMNCALPFVPARFDVIYATDLNDNDDYRNIIIELISEYDIQQTLVFCYNSDGIQLTGEVSGNYDISYDPGNGKFYTWSLAGYGSREIGPASYRREYFIDGLTFTEVGSSIGYFTDGKYVDGYPVTLSDALPIYSDADCRQLLGSIPAGTSAMITDGREKLDAYGYSQGFDFYIESPAGSGWTSVTGLDSAKKSDYHLD